jgi:hypothetical protein
LNDNLRIKVVFPRFMFGSFWLFIILSYCICGNRTGNTPSFSMRRPLEYISGKQIWPLERQPEFLAHYAEEIGKTAAIECGVRQVPLMQSGRQQMTRRGMRDVKQDSEPRHRLSRRRCRFQWTAAVTLWHAGSTGKSQKISDGVNRICSSHQFDIDSLDIRSSRRSRAGPLAIRWCR